MDSCTADFLLAKLTDLERQVALLKHRIQHHCEMFRIPHDCCGLFDQAQIHATPGWAAITQPAQRKERRIPR